MEKNEKIMKVMILVPAQELEIEHSWDEEEEWCEDSFVELAGSLSTNIEYEVIVANPPPKIAGKGNCSVKYEE